MVVFLGDKLFLLGFGVVLKQGNRRTTVDFAAVDSSFCEGLIKLDS